MKKFVKVTAIVALVLTILGVILFSIGAIGGGIQGVKFLAKTGALSFGPEDLDFDLIDWNEKLEVVYDIDENTIFNSGYQIFTGGSATFEAAGAEVESLDLELGGSNVQIKNNTEDKWRVEAEGIGKFQAYVQNGTLKVLGVKKNSNISLCNVVIYMPQGQQLDKLSLSIGAGELELRDCITAEHVELAVGAGSMEIEEIEAGDLEASVGAGEIIVNGGNMRNVELAVGAGSIIMKGEITGDIDGSVGMGELDVTVYGSDEKDHNYDLACVAGNLQVGSRTHSGLGVDMYIDNGADTTYDLSCAMGSLSISFR